MTHKMFWDDPYLTQLDTTITSVSRQTVQVAQTIFYAFSGGQESDTGTLGGYPVIQAHKTEQNDILYRLSENHTLQVGDSVTMTIDWQRRYRLMRLHFAAEIILELMYQHQPGIQKIGAHIAEDKSRIDFEWGANISLFFPTVYEKAQTLIRANQPIRSEFTDKTTERRCWDIAGFARVACGGTHLKTTGEVGTINLKRKNIGKGKERIEIYLVDA